MVTVFVPTPRLHLTPDSEETLSYKVYSRLEQDQWKQLFLKLMYPCREIANEEVKGKIHKSY